MKNNIHILIKIKIKPDWIFDNYKFTYFKGSSAFIRIKDIKDNWIF